MKSPRTFVNVDIQKVPQHNLNADIILEAQKSPKDSKLNFDVTMRSKVDRKGTAELALSDGTFSVGFQGTAKLCDQLELASGSRESLPQTRRSMEHVTYKIQRVYSEPQTEFDESQVSQIKKLPQPDDLDWTEKV